MAILSITSGTPQQLGVVQITPVTQDCFTYFQYNITANNGDSININLTGNHYEAKVNNIGVVTNFNDSINTIYNSSGQLYVSFLLLNSGITDIKSTATITITNVSTGYYHSQIVTRDNDTANCYKNENIVTKTSDLFNDGTSGTSSFIEFSNLDLVPTDNSTNPVESNGIFDAIEISKIASNINITPYKTLGSTNVQNIIHELKDELDGISLGGGYMLTSVYDTNSNNKVDLAENSELLNNIASTSFARVDASNIFTTGGTLTLNDNVTLNFGTGLDSKITHNGTSLLIDSVSNIIFRSDNASTENIIYNPVADSITFNIPITIQDDAYDADWNGNLTVPTKNALYDQLETIAAGGEVNTASNLGTGTGIYASKSLADLRFKSLVAGTNITITNDSNNITINSTGAASSTWGSITGTLSSQTDLNTVLIAKPSLNTLSNTSGYLHINRSSTDPALFINQLNTGPIARFFKGSTSTSQSGIAQVEITSAGDIISTGIYYGNGSGLTNVNATTLDNLDSIVFVRTNAQTIRTAGNLIQNDNIKLQLGTGLDFSLYHNGSANYIDLANGNLIIRDNSTERFIFERTTGVLQLQRKLLINDVITNDWGIRLDTDNINYSGLFNISGNFELHLRNAGDTSAGTLGTDGVGGIVLTSSGGFKNDKYYIGLTANAAQSSRYWRIDTTVDDPNLSFALEAAPGADSFTKKYTLHYTGTPTNNTDLVTKAYTDSLTTKTDITVSPVITTQITNGTGSLLIIGTTTANLVKTNGIGYLQVNIAFSGTITLDPGEYYYCRITITNIDNSFGETFGVTVVPLYGQFSGGYPGSIYSVTGTLTNNALIFDLYYLAASSNIGSIAVTPTNGYVAGVTQLV